MSFIDNIKEEIQSTYIIGTFHREGSRGYFDDLRGTAGERIEDFDGKPIEAKIYIPRTDLTENEFYEFDWSIEGDSEANYSFVCTGNIREVDKSQMLQVRLDEKKGQRGTIRKDANQNQEMINREVTGAPHTYIYELLQNSNDYPRKDINNNKIPVEVKFILTENYLFLVHSGAPFNLKNIAAICTVNEGEKRDNTETIGYKGMGFKSVFVNNDYVFLSSGGWNLRFDEKEINKPGGYKRNWQYMPIPTSMDEVDDEIKSVFNSIPSGMNVFFALRHIRDARENEPNLEKVFSDDQILVFIPHVDHVDVVIDGDTAFSVSKDREKWIIKDDLHIPVGDDYKEILEKSIKEGNKIPEKFQKIEKISISFAVRRDGNKIVPIEDAKIYNYLPTEQRLHVPFLLNADFVPDASRKSIPDLEWNIKLLEDAGKEFASWWVSLLEEGNGYDLGSVFDILPEFKDVDPYRNAFMRGFVAQIVKLPCIPVDDNGVYRIVSIDRIISETRDFIISEKPVMSDKDFYQVCNKSTLWNLYLPHPDIRLNENAQKLISRFSSNSTILNKDDYVQISCNTKFKEWLSESTENAIRYYDFLFRSSLIHYQLECNDSIFLAEDMTISSGKSIFLNIDEALEYLYMFEDKLPRLNVKVREAMCEQFSRISTAFKPYNSVDEADKLASEFDLANYAKRIRTKDDSVNFLGFLATASGNGRTYTKGIPSTMPIYLNNGEVVEGTANLYVQDDFGDELRQQAWVDSAWIHFIHSTYVSDYWEALTVFMTKNSIVPISAKIAWDEIISPEERLEYIIGSINEKETNIAFYNFLQKIEKEIILDSELKSKLVIFANDGTDEELVPLSMQLYWEDDNWRNFLYEKWLPKQSCWVVDDEYLSTFVGKEREAMRKFFTSKFIANKFSVSDFFNKCLNGCWSEIIQLIDTKEISFEFLKFLFDHRNEIAGSFKNERFGEIPLFYEGEDDGNAMDDFLSDVTVYQHSDEIDVLCDEPWFDNTQLTVLDDIYRPLFESKDGRDYFDKVGIKFFDLISYLRDMVIENLEDYDETLSTKNNNLLFHRYFGKIYTKFTKEDIDTLKQASIFVSSPESSDGVLCDKSDDHYLPSGLLTNIIKEDIVPIRLLDSVHPDYCQSDLDREYLLSLGNCELAEDNFLEYIGGDSNREAVKEYITIDKARNIRFWRWIVDFTSDESELRKLRGLPILTSLDTFETDGKRMYSAEDFTIANNTHELISDFIENPLFVSDRYLEDGNPRNWRPLFVSLGINITAKYIILNKLVPNLANYKRKNVVFYLAPYVNDITQWINDNDEVRLKQLEDLYLLCEDGIYRKVKETLVSGSFVGLSTSVYPEIVINNLVSDLYIEECNDNGRLKDNVIKLIVEISRRFSKLRSDARVYRNTKIRFFIDNQDQFLSSTDHYKIIATLADDYRKDGEDDEFKKLFDGKKIILYTTRGNQVESDKLYLSSKYQPLCDFMKYEVNTLSFVSEEYAEYGDIKNLRKFFIWQLGVRNDFSEGTIGCLENEKFSRYFWREFLVATNSGQYSLQYDSILTAQTLYNVRCIPTKSGNKRPGFLYDSRIDELCKMVAAIGKKDSNLPDVTIPKGYLIGLKGALTFEDCLLYLKTENPAFREIVYKTMIKFATDHPEQFAAWIKQGYVTNFREEARWYCGKKSWEPIKNLVALKWAENHSILKDNFGFSKLVISKMPSGKDDYNKLCEILQIRILTNDDFGHTYDDKSEIDHLAIEEITKRLLYLSYRHNPETWEEEFKTIQKELADTDIRICNSISYFWTENDALSADLLTYTEELDTLWYVGNWNGAAFGDIIEWIVKKFPFLKAFDFNVIKTCFYKDFKVILKEIDKLPTNFLNYLSEDDKEGLSVDDYDEAQINTDVEQLAANDEDDSSNENNSKPGSEEKEPEKNPNSSENTDYSKTGDYHDDHREEDNGHNHHTENDGHLSNNGNSHNESDESDPGDFKKQSYERWERDAKKQPVAPKSDQPLVKDEGATFDPEETPKTDPEYGDAYDSSARSGNDYGDNRNTRSNTGNQELRKAKEQERTAREKLSRREMLNRVPKYTLEWFNYRLDVCLEDQKSYSAREVTLDFHDWCKINPDQNLYRLISPDGYIPMSFADYNNQIVSVITNGKRYQVDARVIEADETGVDLICSTDLGNPIEGRRIQIQATSMGGFTDHLVSRFRKLQNNYTMASNLRTMLPDNISFIYGPPGTGKTYQLVKTISDLIRTNYKINILVLTPTNRAADEIAERLCTDTFAGEYTSRYGVTESRILAEEHYGCLKNRHNMDMSLNKNVIITTIARYPYDTVRKGQFSENIFDLKWDYIIVDEASMIDVIDITLLLLNKKADKFIIAGDPNQIRPITPHDIEECNIYDMVGLSSFKLAKENTFKYPVTALDTQYRSVPQIGGMVSKFCYDGLLKTNPNRTKQKPLNLKGLNVETANAIGFNVEMLSYLYGWNKVDNSPVHVYSAIFAYEFAAYIAKEISKNHPTIDYTIGIVTPYGKQKEAIKQLLEQKDISTQNCKVKCGTAHSFQGGECDIMIVVMNYPDIYSGCSTHINNKNIMNVAMSRARDYLFFLWPEVKPEHKSKTNADKLPYIMNQQIGRLLPAGFKQLHAFDIEEIIFGDKTFIAKNSGSRCHMPVNVSAASDKRYEIRLSDTALDIQIND